jgi:hypothetical protein
MQAADTDVKAMATVAASTNSKDDRVIGYDATPDIGGDTIKSSTAGMKDGACTARVGAHTCDLRAERGGGDLRELYACASPAVMGKVEGKIRVKM